MPAFEDQRGFAPILFLPVVFIVLGIVLLFAFHHFHKDSDSDNKDGFAENIKKFNFNKDSNNEEDVHLLSPFEAGKKLSNDQCSGEGFPYKLSRSPMEPEDFSIVIPYGLLAGAHVTPIDHQYFSPKEYNSPLDAYEVYAMADSTIVDIGERERNENGKKFVEYRLVFAITCNFLYYYDLVTSLVPEIQKEYENARKGSNWRPLSIKVKEGQLIGRIGGQTLDFAVWDTTKKLSGFVVPEHYNPEYWKIYTADPLDYYTPELKEFILSRYIRTVEPVSGKIDYDIDGTLIGNWFLEGTKDYAGGNNFRDPEYWKGHLAIVPDHIDPRGVYVSFGDFNGEATQFFVHNLYIRPEKVNKDTGIVRYELGNESYLKENGEHWDRNSMAKNLKIVPNQEFDPHCVLLQLVEDRKLKMEYFTGTKCSPNLEFTNKAKIYLR